MRKAQVFISCGQSTQREKQIGHSLVEYFEGRGFGVYFAERVHSSEALTQSIFAALRRSEYFVFVDFRRGRLGWFRGMHRGSIFVNQEVAIATFLRLDGIGFVERGVAREGIRQYHIYNEKVFGDWSEILSELDARTSNWNPSHANELVLHVGEATIDVRLANGGRAESDWYHLRVENRSKFRHALFVYAYVTDIVDISSGNSFDCPSNELVWAGQGNDLTANIMSGSSKALDAFFVVGNEGRIHFHQRGLQTNNPRYHLPTLNPGVYEVEYTVLASNFETAKRRFRIDFSGTRKSVEFAPTDGQV